jgi:1-acyl-sn-glycerol-3-phosphate acyltransferase
MTPKQSSILPRISRWLRRLFLWYTRYYVSGHFHAVRVSNDSRWDFPAGVPMIVLLNHPSWWDPLICLLLSDAMFPKIRHFAPIEEAMLDKYRFFRRLGFFGVEPGSARGARSFLRIGRAICQQQDCAMWITAQGQFTDVRARPIVLRPGLAHLLPHVKRAILVPLAIEYVFWNERLPEALVHFGKPIDWQRDSVASSDLPGVLNESLTGAQDALQSLALARDAGNFKTLLAGKVGVGGIYDVWRRVKAVIRGQKFDPAHGRACV